jgi:hypothetical protein
MLAELNDKNADIDGIAQKALHDPKLLSELLEGLDLKVSPKSGEETIRYNCFKVLTRITETQADALYPEWERLAAVRLKSDNSYHKMAAIQLIARLVEADKENKFETIFEQFYGSLDDPSVIVAIYTASASGRIVRARPELESRVTDRLLGIDDTHHTSGHKALIAAGVIQAFNEYFELSANRSRIIDFAKTQQGSESPKTRKLAKTFLKHRAD